VPAFNITDDGITVIAEEAGAIVNSFTDPWSVTQTAMANVGLNSGGSYDRADNTVIDGLEFAADPNSNGDAAIHVYGSDNCEINDVTIYALSKAPQMIKKTRSEIGIIAVPKEYSQEVADVIALCGLRGIINFTPTSITAPKNIVIRDIDLTIEFLSLFCDIQR